MPETVIRRSTVAFRVILALVFVIAGGSKIAQPWVFVHTVEAYNMLPEGVTRPFGLALPWIEVLLASYLLVGLFTRIAAAAIAITLILFLIAITGQLVRGHSGSCGCVVGIDNPLITAFVGGDSIGVWDLIRDMFLLLMALTVMLVPRGPLALDRLLFDQARHRARNAAEYTTSSV